MKRTILGFMSVAILLAGRSTTGQQESLTRPTPNQQPALGTQTAGRKLETAGHKLEKVRPPAVAGMFYPEDRQTLTDTLDKLLADAKVVPIKHLRGLLCPHAGYEFSGSTAAAAYKQLVGRDVRTVVVMGPSHYASFWGGALIDADGYRTPLGVVPIAPAARQIALEAPFALEPPCAIQRPGWWQRSGIDVLPDRDTPQTWEHSVEVQVPFLQRVLPKAELVPIVFGTVDPADAARVLARYCDDKTIFVASSDLSHYLPYEDANRIDAACTKSICNLEVDGLTREQACGRTPLRVLMHLAQQKHWQTSLLKQCNSGDTTGDKSRVVGYAAIAFYETDEPRSALPQTEPATAGSGLIAPSYTPVERKWMLELARAVVQQAAQGKPLPEPKAGEVAAKLTRQRACFVTLTKSGQLRGCIGSIFPREPLYLSVLHMAHSATLEDHRFTPVQPEELDQIAIEISVLSIPRPLDFSSPEDLAAKLRPGTDGVVLQVGQFQSVYLPQVWEHFARPDVFLSELAQKAGMPPSGWRNPGAEVLVFQVEAFKETRK